MTPGAAEAAASLLDALVRIAGIEPRRSPFALGWATVELDRAERAFAAALGGHVTAIADAPDDAALGARCRKVTTDLPGLSFIVLLEPSSEGRLAASLARHGEGPVAAWLRPDAPGGVAGSAISSGTSGGGAPGPFGPELLLAGTPATGPHRLLVLWPGTITP